MTKSAMQRTGYGGAIDITAYVKICNAAAEKSENQIFRVWMRIYGPFTKCNCLMKEVREMST